MDYFIADTHFGHDQVRAERGFASLDEMDNLLLARWQARVSPTDDIYIVGDFLYRSPRPPAEYLRQLPGRKHLVIGNHDRAWMRGLRLQNWFVEVGHVLEGERKSTYFTCCHYPMLDWYRRRHGAHLIYGHIHNHTNDFYYPFLTTLPRAYNAGADVLDYTPCTLAELIARAAQSAR